MAALNRVDASCLRSQVSSIAVADEPWAGREWWRSQSVRRGGPEGAMKSS